MNVISWIQQNEYFEMGSTFWQYWKQEHEEEKNIHLKFHFKAHIIRDGQDYFINSLTITFFLELIF
jgi:hypothetical protein